MKHRIAIIFLNAGCIFSRLLGLMYMQAIKAKTELYICCRIHCRIGKKESKMESLNAFQTPK